MEATLDRFGRIVLPKRVRDDLGLHPGSVLKVEERERGILLSPADEGPALQVKDGVLVYSAEATGDLKGAVRAHREGRIHKFSTRKKS